MTDASFSPCDRDKLGSGMLPPLRAPRTRIGRALLVNIAFAAFALAAGLFTFLHFLGAGSG
jgi:hypothetical protein